MQQRQVAVLENVNAGAVILDGVPDVVGQAHRIIVAIQYKRNGPMREAFNREIKTKDDLRILVTGSVEKVHVREGTVDVDRATNVTVEYGTVNVKRGVAGNVTVGVGDFKVDGDVKGDLTVHELHTKE